MQHIVMFSGGIGSWAAAKRLSQRGTGPLTLLFCDTRMEDADLYRFLTEAAGNVGGKLVRIQDGRTPWQVFYDTRFLGNTRVDPCSRILKRALAKAWIEQNANPRHTILYMGMDWTEMHRLVRSQRFWAPWRVEAPMCEEPLIDKPDMLKALEAEGIRVPRLYDLGFPHNNCGGFCIKAGKAHFKLLLEKLPERYRFHERAEAAMRKYLGRNVSILTDQRGGFKTPMTLADFRCHLTTGGEVDP
ncbi:hypothetical protein LCGC14_3043610, partial [marine sediment metagenome]